jgi:hypothetical protein
MQNERKDENLSIIHMQQENQTKANNEEEKRILLLGLFPIEERAH